MITELPICNQWQVTFRTSSSADDQYASQRGELPSEAESFAKKVQPASEPAKRAVA